MLSCFRVSLVLLSLGAVGQAQATLCDGPVPQPLPIRSSPVAPLAMGIEGRPAPLTSSHLLLAVSRDESLALDVVLLRLRQESCAKDAFADYKPRTAFDNTPWRYNMEKGKAFTAAEFDAWMKSRGVRVAKGKAAVPAASDPAAAAVETATVVDY